jgi:hypothetical protein
MCQPSPLARCANHANKEAQTVADKMFKNFEDRVAIGDKIRDLKIEAQAMGLDEEAIMDPDTPGLEELNRLREEHERLTKENVENVKDTWENELHLDATPNGIKMLEKGVGRPGYSDSRLKNANALNAWQKKIRDLKDSNGNKLTAKGGNLDDRHKVYLQEFITARSEHKAAQDSSYEANRRLGILNTKLAQFETKNVGFQDVGDRRRGSQVAVNPEDADEVDHLERQKTRVLEMENQAHHDQVLARSKMNSLRKAIQINRKAQNKIALANAVAKQRETLDSVTEDLKKSKADLYEKSKAFMGAEGEEFTSATSKAYAVETGIKILEKHRAANPDNNRKALIGFSSEMHYLRNEAVAKAKDAEDRKDEYDEALYSGEASGISHLLWKIRNLS